MSRPRDVILCLGELLVDVATDGQEFAGGAPANVAAHAASLGMPSVLVSRVGDDVRGHRLRCRLAEVGVDAECVQFDAAVPTGAVLVHLADGAPSYEIASPAAWDFIADAPEPDAAARAAGVVVFGTLAQRHPVSRASIRRLVSVAADEGATLLADLNLREPFYDVDTVLWCVRHCDVLKLNDGELQAVSGLLGARGERLDLFSGLLREFGLRRGVLTCGAEGAWLCEDGALWHVPAAPVEVVDTVGAGDAFSAVLAVFLGAGFSLHDAGPWCAEIAAAVVSQRGATPAIAEELRTRLLHALGRGR